MSSSVTEHRKPPYKLLLVTAAALWGGSFVVLKNTFDAITPAWLLGIRFVLSGLLMGAIFHKAVFEHLDRRHIKAGVALGVTGGIAYLVQNLGLNDTTPGHNAFLTATYCVMVPFLNWIFCRVRPTMANACAAFLALAGVGVLSLGGDDPFKLAWGDWMTLFGAFWFAVQIIVMAHVAQGSNIIVLTVIEFFVMGVVNLLYGIVCDPFPPLSLFGDPHFLFQLAYLVVLSSCLCTLIQNIGQANVEPSQASLLMSLESVFGVFFSIVVYGEPVTPQLIFGFALVFVAVLISELIGSKRATPAEAA